MHPNCVCDQSNCNSPSKMFKLVSSGCTLSVSLINCNPFSSSSLFPAVCLRCRPGPRRCQALATRSGLHGPCDRSLCAPTGPCAHCVQPADLCCCGGPLQAGGGHLQLQLPVRLQLWIQLQGPCPVRCLSVVHCRLEGVVVERERGKRNYKQRRE